MGESFFFPRAAEETPGLALSGGGSPPAWEGDTDAAQRAPPGRGQLSWAVGRGGANVNLPVGAASRRFAG